MRGLFGVTWEYPNIEPPAYLEHLHPALYEEESQRVAARFDEAVQLAEQAFVTELTGLVAHLTERLTGQADNKPKVFRNSTIENLVEFFRRFRQLNVRSNQELDELVSQAEQIVQGVELPVAARQSGVAADRGQRIGRGPERSRLADGRSTPTEHPPPPGHATRGGLMELVVHADGSLRCLYDETVDLSPLGQVAIRRASHVDRLP